MLAEARELEDDPCYTKPEELGIGALFGIIHEAAIVIDRSTSEIVLWNDAACEIFGWTKEQACGMDVADLLAEEEKCLVLAHRISGDENPYLAQPDTGEVLSVTCMHRLGQHLRVEATVSTLNDNYLISIVRDVTRKKRLEAYAVAVVEEMAKREIEELPNFSIPQAPVGIKTDYKMPTVPLTRRELEILGHVARGASNARIARLLFISESTVKTHMTSVIAKMEVANRAEAGVKAVKLGLLD